MNDNKRVVEHVPTFGLRYQVRGFKGAYFRRLYMRQRRLLHLACLSNLNVKKQSKVTPDAEKAKVQDKQILTPFFSTGRGLLNQQLV